MQGEAGAAVLAALAAGDLTGRSSAARDAHRLVTGYVRTNLHRRDAPGCRNESWQLGSGPIAAAYKMVVNPRRKQSGLRWGSDGANAVGPPRVLYEGETSQWDAFWERSINQGPNQLPTTRTTLTDSASSRRINLDEPGAEEDNNLDSGFSRCRDVCGASSPRGLPIDLHVVHRAGGVISPLEADHGPER